MELARDLAFGFRLLRKRPGFTVAAALALALGIGATTTIFSAVDVLLFRPLPYPAPDRLVTVREVNHEKAQADSDVSPVQFADFRDQISSFEGVAGWWYPDLNLTGHDREPERISTADVTDNFFSVMGVEPAVGRGFLPGEDRSGAALVVVIGYELWMRRFGGDRGLVGRPVYLDGRENLVVGIAPRGFRYPGQTEVWRPLGWDPAQHGRGARFFGVVARLEEGKTIEDARAEIEALTTRLGREFPATNAGWGAIVVPLLHSELGRTREGLLVLLGAVGFVLFLACANVANLLMAQGMARADEVAIRTALGASRKKLTVQFLAESLSLSLVGGAAGLVLAVYGVAALKRIVPVMVPRLEEVSVDSRVLLFTLGVVAATAFIFGAIPAWQTSKGAPSGARTTGRRTRDVFVVTQVAVALLMLVGAALLMRSFERLVREDPGYIPFRSVAFNLQVPSSSYQDWNEVSDFYARLVEGLSQIPEVRGAAATAFLPLEPGWRIPFTVRGRPPVPEGEEPQVQYHAVSPGYFRLMGVPLLRGRDLSDRDLAEGPGVVVVNDAARRRYWPDEDPVGARVLTGVRQFGPLGRVMPESLELEVVGVVADVKNSSLQADPEPAFYFSFRQFAYRSMNVVVRSETEGEALAPRLKEEVWRLDPELPVSEMRPLEVDLERAVAAERFVLVALAGFALLALALAAVGTYGVLSCAAGERRREMAIRMALGAKPRTVTRDLLGRALALSSLGIALGAGAAWFLGRYLESFLFGISAHDPLAFLVASSVLVATALAASYLPARRASRADPWTTLRAE
ncbi:MAG: ABC transporter permease [Vicinamibacteria bacterium]